MPTPHISFAAWIREFREDCNRHGRRAAFDVMGDKVLRLLWQSGLAPTVKALAYGVYEEKSA